MAGERRSGVIRQAWEQPGNREEFRTTCKPYDIPKTFGNL